MPEGRQKVDMDIQRALLKAAVTAAGIIFIYQASNGIKQHALDKSSNPASEAEKQLERSPKD